MRVSVFVMAMAVATLRTAAARESLRRLPKNVPYYDNEACVVPCATLHRITATCDLRTNGSAVTTCGTCLPGFDGPVALPTVPCVVNETYWTGDDDDDDSDGYGYGSYRSESRGSAMSMQMTIGSALGSVVVLLMCVISWRGWLDCCAAKRKRDPHRAFLEPTTKEWTCEVCLHTNSSLRRYCVLCKSELNEQQVEGEPKVESSSYGGDEKAPPSENVYVLVETPRAARRSKPSITWTDDQRLATERLEWKRCVNKQSMRWLRFDVRDVRRVPALRGTVVREKDLASLDLFKKNPNRCIQSTASMAGFFVLQDQQAVTVWHPVEHAVFSAHPYRQWRSVEKIARLPFDGRLRWFQQELLKVRHQMIEHLFTIHVHRQHILKQTMELFMTAPAATLRRHLRVDFMDEPGIDGGGILREWLQLVCKELFSDTLGLFKQTTSTLDGGYWINRTSTRKSKNQLQMYTFFGMLLAKAVLEGLVLNVRLAIPLLKHILGSPLSKDDLQFLDEQIYSSVNYILVNQNVDELSLTFSIADKELISNGSDTAVNDDNKQRYVDHLVQFYLFDSIEEELSAIMRGFHTILPTTPLHVFDYKELDLLVSGLGDIDVLDWQAHTNVCVLGHDEEKEQQVVDWFWEVVGELNNRSRCRLLQYVTGSSGVPVEGFAALTSLDGRLQPFTIQLTDNASRTYSTLPYASTCFNRLDLPVYDTKSDLEQMMQLLVATDATGFNRR